MIEQVAKAVNITDLLKLDAQRLSGGQKQRVAIASVLAINPKIIIFDESTSMLDPKGKADLKELMLLLKNKYHKTIISITHDMEEVVNADKVIILKAGQIQKIGTPPEVFENQEFLRDLKLDIPFNLELSK
ncbi:MAG: ATP-binding cassette domain-containing protein, partial [Mycoplasmoidaceae bacterium]|nr:ATP-binding cassette domain-containing protein [Mycoplasmoidaceae bacterium]